MLPSDTALLLFLSVAACIHVAVLGLAIWQLYDSRRLTKDEDALILQEVEKIRRLVQN